jgi:hypothetical protein
MKCVVCLEILQARPSKSYIHPIYDECYLGNSVIYPNDGMVFFEEQALLLPRWFMKNSWYGISFRKDPIFLSLYREGTEKIIDIDGDEVTPNYWLIPTHWIQV